MEISQNLKANMGLILFSCISNEAALIIQSAIKKYNHWNNVRVFFNFFSSNESLCKQNVAKADVHILAYTHS